MDRLITVKGTGTVSLKPDITIITMNLESQHLEYDQTMQLATNSVDMLTSAIESAGFDKKDLKTTNFNIRTNYESYTDHDNNYKTKFVGYICEQELKIEFDFDSKMISNVFSAISKSTVHPRLGIEFSVRDKTAVIEELLIQTAENARKKSAILVKAAGVKLGQLMSINYNWDEIHLYSPTRYDMESKVMALGSSAAPNIEPDDITVSDAVAYVWEIE